MRIFKTKNQSKNCTNQLLENLRKVHSSSIDNIWGADLANIQLINKFDKGIFGYVLFIFSVNTYGLFLKIR